MSTLKTTMIRPGILVALKTSVAGGVSYTRVDLDAPVEGLEGSSVARWETTRKLDDAAEHERATKTRSKAAAVIGALCARTAFGLLVPEGAAEEALDRAVEAAHGMVREFNEGGATYTRISLYVLKGRIASTDAEAARAIGSEVASLVSEMGSAIDRLDPTAIRNAATRAAEIGMMLGEEQQAVVEDAIIQARKAARMIVKRIEKEGEAAAIVLADVQRGAIEKARIAFLDLDEPTAIGEASPAVDLNRVAALDLEDVAPAAASNVEAVA